MSGHSKWAQIKHKKGITDQKRGRIFSKILSAITAAAKMEVDPQYNPRLRTAIETAHEAQVPSENIERAIKRAREQAGQLDELMLEAYGPGAIAIIIMAITDNKNRTIPEVKKILADFGGKWGEGGSVRWAFEFDAQGKPTAKFPQAAANSEAEALRKLTDALEEHPDVQEVYTNAA